jgi:hypothetical protein
MDPPVSAFSKPLATSRFSGNDQFTKGSKNRPGTGAYQADISRLTAAAGFLHLKQNYNI